MNTLSMTSWKPAPLAQISGVFTRALTSFDGSRRVAADQAGYRAVVVQLVETPNAAANERAIQILRSEFRAMGWLIGGWGTFGQSPNGGSISNPAVVRQQGVDARASLQRNQLDFWMPNGEMWAEGAFAWQSKEWMAGWVDGLVHVEQPPVLMLSCLSSTTPNYARTMDFSPWLAYPGCGISPQCYTASYPDYTIAAMEGSFAKVPVPPEILVPTFDVVKGRPVPASYQQYDGPRWLYTGEDTLPNQFAQTV